MFRLFMTIILAISFQAKADGSPEIWSLPKFSEKQQNKILSKYDYSVLVKKGVPAVPLREALFFFEEHKDQFNNKDFMVIIDMTKHAAEERFHLINLRNSTTRALQTSHGMGSDKKLTGYAQKFSNKPNSEMTSLGFYVTEDTYKGKHGLSLRLRGVSKTNTEAYERAIVVHGAWYVGPGKIGRSQGCPALAKKEAKRVIEKIKDGSLLYIWDDSLETTPMAKKPLEIPVPKAKPQNLPTEEEVASMEDLIEKSIDRQKTLDEEKIEDSSDDEGDEEPGWFEKWK